MCRARAFSCSSSVCPGFRQGTRHPVARSFVDEDLLAALQGSDLARAVIEGAETVAESRWLNGLSPSARRMAAHLLRNNGYGCDTTLAVAARWARTSADRAWESQRAADALVVALELAPEGDTLDARGLTLTGVQIEELDLEDRALASLAVSDAVIGHLMAGDGLSELTDLRISKTLIGRVSGVPSVAGLQDDVFVGCTFGDFDDTSTTAAVVRLDLPAGLRVMMTILRKSTCRRAGAGRQLPSDEASPKSWPFWSMQQCISWNSEGIVVSHGGVVHPVRRHAARARKMLAAGITSDDVVMHRAARLTLGA